MRKKLLPLGRLFESAWYNPILKAVPMSMGILMSGNAGYAIAGNMSDNVVIVQQQTISVTSHTDTAICAMLLKQRKDSWIL